MANNDNKKLWFGQKRKKQDSRTEVPAASASSGIYSTAASRGQVPPRSWGVPEPKAARARKDAPIRRLAKSSGALPDLSAEAARTSARKDFDEDILAPSHRHVVKAKLGTIEKALKFWILASFPPYGGEGDLPRDDSKGGGLQIVRIIFQHVQG